MGSPSLIIILMIVVWVIVLAPLVFGNNKPIRRSGDGYDETRVLHEGGTEPIVTRRNPRLTAADVHQYGDEEGYEDAELVEDVEAVLIDDTDELRDLFAKRAGSTIVRPEELAEEAAAEASADAQESGAEVLEGEVVDPELDGAGAAESDTDTDTETDTDADAEATPDAETSADASADASAGAEEEAPAALAEVEELVDEHYEFDDTYASPSDFGYPENPESTEDPAVSDELSEQEPNEAADSASDSDVENHQDVEVAEEDIAFAASRRGRGGWDPERAKRAKADRFMRRQRTFLGLIIASVLTFVVAVVFGGWTWVLPATAIGLTVWFMVVLRRVVRQERALYRRRMRRLRRARLGVALPREHTQARYGNSIALTADDASPDFEVLPTYQQPPQEHVRNRRYPGDLAS